MDSPEHHILIVDDEPQNLDLLQTIMEKNYGLSFAINGTKALEAVEKIKPDLILLDVMMPDMDGYAVCSLLKASDATRDIPVMFISSLSQTEDKVKAFQNGGVDYITKPFQPEEVLARVGTHLELQRSRQALRENYEQLKTLEELRDNLVHMVVHDMRTPLTVLLSNIGFLKTDLEDQIDEQNKTDINEILKAAQKLNIMANDLLDVSRLEQGQMPLKKVNCDLPELVTKTVEKTKRLEPTRDIQLYSPDHLMIECDQGIVERILMNLISNGLKHTDKTHPLSVFIEKKQNGVRVSVQDQGEGVPEAFRKEIFKKFGTVKIKRENKYHSAGLGLAFCKLAVEAHGGTIGLESIEGKGSTFYFILP